MENSNQNKSDFMLIYNKSSRLASAVFLISGVIGQEGDIQDRIKKLSLTLVSESVKLKDVNVSDAKKLVSELEKISLELMSLFNIAGISGLVSKMNEAVLREEFQSFVSELERFGATPWSGNNISIQEVLGGYKEVDSGFDNKLGSSLNIEPRKSLAYKANTIKNSEANGNGLKRKDLRKNAIFEFIKGHDGAGIKDIVPNVSGCSEKTVQRELIALIGEGKIRKVGERRWSRYSIA